MFNIFTCILLNYWELDNILLNMAQYQEYLDILQTRAEIYRRWDFQLKKFLEKREFVEYNEVVQDSTKELKEIREHIRSIVFKAEISDLIERIERIEDDHLRANVEFHKSRILGQECSYNNVKNIEKEIMEMIQEMISDYA